MHGGERGREADGGGYWTNNFEPVVQTRSMKKAALGYFSLIRKASMPTASLSQFEPTARMLFHVYAGDRIGRAQIVTVILYDADRWYQPRP